MIAMILIKSEAAVQVEEPAVNVPAALTEQEKAELEQLPAVPKTKPEPIRQQPAQMAAAERAAAAREEPLAA